MPGILVMAILAIFQDPGGPAAKDYPRAELLIEPAALADASDADWVILDARPRSEYDEAHVPGAVWVDASQWAKGFGDGKDSDGWSQRIGELGVSERSKVVVYDDNSSKDAARIWWILRYWGVDHVRLLNGGWAQWESEDRPVQSGSTAPAKTHFQARGASRRLATKELLLGSLRQDGADGLQIVDTRSEGEYCGTAPGKNKRAGAIPTAKHLEWSDLIDPATQRFKSPSEMAELFDSAGIDLDQPAVTHCQSGGRASVMAFGLELMGASDVRNYYAGWSEWGNLDDTPIEPGKPSQEGPRKKLQPANKRPGN